MAKRIIVYFFLVLAGLTLLAYVDHIVVDKIYKELIANHAMNWPDFETGPGGRMWWHIGLDILSLGLFGLLALAARQPTVFIGGLVLYHTGLEDLFYYWVQGLSLPKVWEWCDLRPLIGYTRYLTRTENVSLPGMLFAVAVGLALYAGTALLFRKRGSKKPQQP